MDPSFLNFLLLSLLIRAKHDWDGDDNWSCKTCKAAVKSSPPTNQHPAFYRLDALPVARPTVSKHWRESTEGNTAGVVKSLCRTWHQTTFCVRCNLHCRPEVEQCRTDRRSSITGSTGPEQDSDETALSWQQCACRRSPITRYICATVSGKFAAMLVLMFLA